MTATLSIVGCGRLGRSLARLWQESGTFEIASVANRSLRSAREAVEFIGHGRAVDRNAELGSSDAVLLAVPDGEIERTCDDLALTGAFATASLVFHCSGALSSRVLESARRAGANIASVHPVKSFADPAIAVQSFAGTWCGIEGDAPALDRLRPAFEAIGARLFDVDAEEKATYHAGAVMACNYLVTLVDAGLRCYERAGVPREQARAILTPLLEGTVANLSERDTGTALTGPIARGEAAVVAAQLDALEAFAPDIASLYRSLGRETLEIARRSGDVSREALDALATLLAE
jgi:predicted short-subunit dehydrogenase-like oxidoreductase (DUF2520 family)